MSLLNHEAAYAASSLEVFLLPRSCNFCEARYAIRHICGVSCYGTAVLKDDTTRFLHRNKALPDSKYLEWAFPLYPSHYTQVSAGKLQPIRN